MTTFTSSLPNELLEKLDEISKSFGVPKNKIIRLALDNYIRQLEKKMYEISYKKLAGDKDILNMAEEGIEDYFTQLIEQDEKK